MAGREDIKGLFKPSNGNAVTAMFVTAFFCYFASESMLRQAAVGKMHARGMTVDAIVAKLPEGIRESVRHKIEITRLRDRLKNINAPRERIFTMIALGGATSGEALESAYADVLDQYPSHPAAAQAYIHFLLAPEGSKRNVSLSQFQAFLLKVPETERLPLWTSAYSKMIEKGVSPERVFDFFKPLLDAEPRFKDYKLLFLDLAEFAFQSGMKQMELKCKALSEHCDSLPTIDMVLAERKKKESESK